MIIGKAISPFALRKKNGGSGAANDPDAQLFITATGISGTNATATNKLVVDLKAANIWTKMKCIYPFVGNTSASQKYNLKDPRDLDIAFRLTFNGGGTFSANGYQPNGTNSFANTFLIPNTSLTLNNSHFSVYLRTNVAGAQYDIAVQDDMGPGVNVLGGTFYMSPRSATNTLDASISTSDANRIITANSDSRGLFITNRTANNSLKQYKNSSLLTTQTALASGYQSRYSVPLGAFRYINDAGSDTYSSYSTREQAFASIGNGLTDAEALALYNAVQLFNTTLGRQV